MTVLFIFLLMTFVYIHYKCKQYAETNLDKLIKQTSGNDSKGIIEEKLSMKGIILININFKFKIRFYKKF